nr:PREDICTED: uncharacterized protein LOC109036875 [Bemisia tabaci]
MDTKYPEPLSNVYKRATRKKMRDDRARYRTQAVTFSEIREVDEENTQDSGDRETSSGLQRSRSDPKLDRLDTKETLRLSRLEETRLKNKIITDLIKSVHGHPPEGSALQDEDPAPEPAGT